MHALPLAILGILLSSTGCAIGPETTFLAANRSPRQVTPRPGRDVQMFVNQRPAGSFVEVGVVKSRGGTTEEAYDAMREHAGRLGCDGLIYGGSDNEDSGEVTVQGHQATCIVYENAADAPPVQAPATAAVDTSTYTGDCVGPIGEWRSESDLGKKTVLYRDLPQNCRDQVDKKR